MKVTLKTSEKIIISVCYGLLVAFGAVRSIYKGEFPNAMILAMIPFAIGTFIQLALYHSNIGVNKGLGLGLTALSIVKCGLALLPEVFDALNINFGNPKTLPRSVFIIAFIVLLIITAFVEIYFKNALVDRTEENRKREREKED